LESQTGKTILITGAGGCIGSALAVALLQGRPRRVLLLDHSEQALYQLLSDLGSLEQTAPYTGVLGDIRDQALVWSLLREYQPALILHAAAFKHVPLMEENPLAAVSNNAVGTYQLVRQAAQADVPGFLLISTDKAANPRSIMGASKRLAELAITRWHTDRGDYASIRLGNVIGSQGSVAPLFMEQIERGGPVTVTHRDAARYFLTLENTVQLILSATKLENKGALLLPDLGEPLRIANLARFLIQNHANGRRQKIEIRFTGLRPGDKVLEDLLSQGETLQPTSDPRLRRVIGQGTDAKEFDASFEILRKHVEARDLPATLAIVRRLVPEYEPSEALRNLASKQTALAGKQ
jgi:FlaA1/EpsC-like NDP-sugar epimerase